MYRQIWSLLCVAAIVGCVAEAPAPVIDKSRPSDYAYTQNQATCKAKTAEEFCHVVERGDTLYAISRRYDLKVVEIASRNEIKAPYIIRPGELLIVRQGTETTSTSKQAAHTQLQRPVEPSRQPVRVATPEPGAVTLKETSIPVLPAGETSSTPESIVANTSSADSNMTAPITPVKMTLRTTRTKSGWQWPVPYEPVSGEDKKGLEYLLADDTEIVAAISGKVIYAGAGLNKFRHLIIVDSATSHLVAYEFNTAHSVTEGQSIGRGDTITRIVRGDGEGGTDQERYRRFRFEIWANGKPLNPNSVIAVAARN